MNVGPMSLMKKASIIKSIRLCKFVIIYVYIRESVLLLYLYNEHVK